jgi:hypothetical protein
VLPSGRLSWYEPATNRWWQRNHFGGAARDTDLGFIERRGLRGFSVNHPRAPKHLQATKMSLEAYEARMGIQRQRALHASQSQAHLLRVHLGNPGGVGDLAIDANAPTTGTLGSHRSGLSDRPQVLAALIKNTVGGNGGDPAAMRRRSLADALATTEERAVVGTNTMRGLGERTQLSPGQPDPTGFEALEDTVHARPTKVAPAAVQPAPSAAATPAPAQHIAEERRETNGESVAQQQAPLQNDKRVQTQLAAQAWAAQRRDGRRMTIPPPMPRSATPPPSSMIGSAGRTTSRVGPSLAPTSVAVSSSSPLVTPSRSSLRDRLILAGTVGAAALAAVALYGSSGSPTSTSAAAAGASANPLPTVATVVPPPPAALTAPIAATSAQAIAAGSAVGATASSGEHRSVEVLPAAKPAAEAPSPGAAPALAPTAPPHAALAARAAKGPRPKLAKQPLDNPYDEMEPGPTPAGAAPARTAAPTGVEPLDRLVDERR